MISWARIKPEGQLPSTCISGGKHPSHPLGKRGRTVAACSRLWTCSVWFADPSHYIVASVLAQVGLRIAIEEQHEHNPCLIFVPCHCKQPRIQTIHAIIHDVAGVVAAAAACTRECTNVPMPDPSTSKSSASQPTPNCRKTCFGHISRGFPRTVVLLSHYPTAHVSTWYLILNRTLNLAKNVVHLEVPRMLVISAKNKYTLS